MKSRSGFTIVEVTIVTVIIAILAAITVVAYTKVQTDARDNTRKGNVAVIGTALEKYYDKNGEYPSVRSLVNNYTDNTGATVAAKLQINASDLLFPKMPSSATNGLISAAAPSNNYIAYIGKSDVNDNVCQTMLTGGCDQFTLKYIQESTGNTLTIDSRHKGRPDSLPTTPSQPNKPSLAVAKSGANVVATATADACESGLTAKYSFRYRTNGGSWSAYSTWSATPTYSMTATEGANYDFQAATRCDNGSTAGDTSPESDITSFAFPITAPTTPAVTVTSSGLNVNATITAVTCASGTTAQYTLRSRTNDGTWGSYSAWSTSLTGMQTGTGGVKYGYQAKARCQSGSNYSSETQGAEGTYVFPVATPAKPTISYVTGGDDVTRWTWNAAGCPSGMDSEYFITSTKDDGYLWTGTYTNSTTDTWYAVDEGYQYTDNVKSRCTNAYITTPWSTVSSDSSYIRPISTPGAPTNFVGSLTADRKAVNWNWTAPSCYSGLQAQDSKTARFSSSGSYGAWTTQGWWASAWSQTITVNGVPTVIAKGSQFQIKAKYVCVNTVTGRQGSWGPEGQAPLFTAP
jgi:prepilin-type N-terminal cleavage/methylation domain-containing protein